MKTIILVSILSITAGVSACAQKINAAKVPGAVRTAFQKQYPGISATWEAEDGNYEAEFKSNGHATSVLYTGTGLATETETEIAVKELPATAQGYITLHYPGQKIKEAAKTVTNSGIITYEAEVKDRDLVFDDKGKFIKEVKE